jgi:hypothetical protein
MFQIRVRRRTRQVLQALALLAAALYYVGTQYVGR